MRKILTVVGARPQFIKASAVSRVLRTSASFSERIVHTGQHYDDRMSDVFFRELGIPEADRNLGIGSGPHGQQTGRMLEALESVILEERPDWVLVYGDTNSTLAGALAAAKLRVKVAHIEAGLRSFNRAMPEETNRIVTDHVSDLLFAPTDTAMENLGREGLGGKAVRTGDVMYDAMLRFSEHAARSSGILAAAGLAPRSFILATIHRAENTDDPVRLGAILDGLAAISSRVPVVLPLHPRTRKMLPSTRVPPTLKLLDPVGYLDMVELERNARLIATDSGGVQKEAYFHRVPCVTLRDETEWVELVSAKWNRLSPPSSSEAVERALAAALDARLPDWIPLYGDGKAADGIVAALASR